MTEQEIIDFCDNMKITMLDALKRSIPVCISQKMDTEQIQWNELTPIDYIYHGQVMEIKFGRPAAKQLAEDAYKKMTINPNAKIGELSTESDPKECK